MSRSQRILNSALNKRVGSAQETLAVLKALTVWVQPSINNVHGHMQLPQPQPACFTRMYHSTSRRTWRSV